MKHAATAALVLGLGIAFPASGWAGDATGNPHPTNFGFRVTYVHTATTATYATTATTATYATRAN